MWSGNRNIRDREGDEACGFNEGLRSGGSMEVSVNIEVNNDEMNDSESSKFLRI